MKEKVLILTYYWPPSGGPGVQRWLKFCRYLPEFGFEPIVLTVDPGQATYPIADASLLKEVPAHLRVYTTSTREPYALYKRIMRRTQVPYSGFANEQNTGVGSTVSRFLRGNLFVPDARVGWNRFALQQARKLIQEENIPYLITTSPPHSTQLVGLKLKKEFPQLRWIADLRDPWTDIFYYKDLLHLPMIRRKDRQLEKQVLAQADTVVTVSNFISNMFVQKVGEEYAARFKVVYNGYDSDDFKEVPPRIKADTFTLAYVGTLADSYRLDGLIHAIKMLKPEYFSRIRLHFTGQICDTWRNALQENFPGKVEFSGHTDHKTAIARMHTADMLLLVIPDTSQNQGILTGKLFEYMAAGRIVVGLGPPKGEAASILEDTRAGVMFDYANAGEIAAFIEKCMEKEYEPHYAAIAKYSRRSLTQYLTTLIPSNHVG